MNYNENEIAKQVMAANNFLKTEEGKNKELLSFINKLIHDRETYYYIKILKFYLFCKLMDWFIEKDFLSNEKGEDRVFIARDLATKICLDIGGKK